MLPPRWQDAKEAKTPWREGRRRRRGGEKWQQPPRRGSRRGCFYHSYRGPILEARSLSPLRRDPLSEKEIGGRLSVATYGDVKDREKEIQKGKELDEEDGIYGRRWRRGRSADGIRGMSCNNRAAIRASVLTTGGATTRLVASARNEGDENSRNFAIGG